MAMGKRRQRPTQPSIWVATQDLPRSAAHPFYARLNHILDTADWEALLCLCFLLPEDRDDADRVKKAAAKFYSWTYRVGLHRCPGRRGVFLRSELDRAMQEGRCP
jgi:hypothetical protein